MGAVFKMLWSILALNFCFSQNAFCENLFQHPDDVGPPNPYLILGVPDAAPLTDVRAAFKNYTDPLYETLRNTSPSDVAYQRANEKLREIILLYKTIGRKDIKAVTDKQLMGNAGASEEMFPYKEDPESYSRLMKTFGEFVSNPPPQRQGQAGYEKFLDEIDSRANELRSKLKGTSDQSFYPDEITKEFNNLVNLALRKGYSFGSLNFPGHATRGALGRLSYDVLYTPGKRLPPLSRENWDLLKQNVDGIQSFGHVGFMVGFLHAIPDWPEDFVEALKERIDGTREPDPRAIVELARIKDYSRQNIHFSLLNVLADHGISPAPQYVDRALRDLEISAIGSPRYRISGLILQAEPTWSEPIYDKVFKLIDQNPAQAFEFLLSHRQSNHFNDAFWRRFLPRLKKSPHAYGVGSFITPRWMGTLPTSFELLREFTDFAQSNRYILKNMVIWSIVRQLNRHPDSVDLRLLRLLPELHSSMSISLDPSKHWFFNLDPKIQALAQNDSAFVEAYARQLVKSDLYLSKPSPAEAMIDWKFFENVNSMNGETAKRLARHLGSMDSSPDGAQFRLIQFLSPDVLRVNLSEFARVPSWKQAAPIRRSPIGVWCASVLGRINLNRLKLKTESEQ